MDIALRASVIFLFIFFLLRIVGRRELSSLEPFDLVLLIVVGDAVQQGITQDDYSVTGALIAISTLALLQMAMSYLGFRVPWTRRVLGGEPIVVVQSGRVIERNLRRERLTPAELVEEARQQQIGSLEDVEWAVLESNGKVTFIPK
jgi:uncharacterized membrane protein YcaP (DUF421 family)